MSFSSDAPSSQRSLHEQVVYAVADANGVDPTDLDPLYHTIDPDALDSLFEDDRDGTIEFRYEGHDVVVHGESGATVDGNRVEIATFQTPGVSDDSSVSATRQ